MKKKSFRQQQLLAAESLDELLQVLKIEPDAWDYLIVGDGSGVGWSLGCGWCSTLVRKIDNHRQLFRGAMDPGTIGLAEMMAFMQPLLYLTSETTSANFQRIHVLSDSQYIVNVGNGTLQAKSHLALWRQLVSFQAVGLQLQFHWIPRDCVALNKLADHMASRCRIAVSQIELNKSLELFSAETLSELNP